MNKKLRFLVHIGTEKTGSTSIQQMLDVNAESLLKRGVYYFRSPSRGDCRELSAAAVGPAGFDDFLRDNGFDTVEKKEAFRIDVSKRFNEEIQRLPDTVHTVALSSEHFHSRLRSSEQVEWLKYLLSPYAQSFEIVVYLRRQIDLALSYYSTELKNGSDVPLSTALDKRCLPGNHYYNYHALLTLWSKHFGTANLHPKIYAKNEFLKGDVTLDFLSFLSDDCRYIDDFYFPKRLNPSLQPLAQDLLRELNALTKAARRESVADIGTLISGLISEFSGSMEVLSLQRKQQIQDRFSESNERVRQVWFPERPRLFSALAAGAQSQQNISDYSRKQLHLIRKILTRLAERPDAGLRHLDHWANHFRDLALAEETASLEGAITLMELAYMIRPRGPVINRKLGEYSILRQLPSERVKRFLGKMRK